MSYSTFGLTHGGIGFYSQIVKTMLVSGWSASVFSYNQSDWGSVPVVQSNTLPINSDITGVPLPFVLELPIMFFQNHTVRKDFTTSVVEGTDYSLDPNFGTATILAGGAFDNGAGFGTGAFTILQGYEIKKGWVILSSTGISTTEDIKIGMRFNSAVVNPTNPFMTGIETDLWTTIPGVAESYDLSDLTRRSDPAHTVKTMISPNQDFTGACSLNLDRVIFHAQANCFTAWCCAGAMQRFRPSTEQDFITGMLGNTTLQADRAGGPVGDTTQGADTSLTTEMGSVYNFNAGRFANTSDTIEMNANRWSNEVGHPTNGYTASRRVIAAGSGATLPVTYFEVHNVITGSEVDQIGSNDNILYGQWNGLYTVLCYEPVHNLQVDMDGRTFRLWSVGDSLTRFIAVEEI